MNIFYICSNMVIEYLFEYFKYAKSITYVYIYITMVCHEYILWCSALKHHQFCANNFPCSDLILNYFPPVEMAFLPRKFQMTAFE